MRIRQSLLAVVFLLSVAPSVLAQATRTWVSGVGDDANPCSRTAPCKTFAGAISKTAAGGEIDALDSGGFGAITITKSITIDGGHTLAGILASATNGVIVNAGVNDVVTLRNLSINGAGTTLGINGIRFIAGKALIVENCVIQQFSNRGISIETSAISKTIIRDTAVRRINNIGIVVLPSAGAPANTVTLERVSSTHNAAHGLYVGAGAKVVARNSVFSENTNVGVFVDEPSGSTECFLEGVVISNNLTGLQNGSGTPQTYISNTMVVNNPSAGLVPGGGGIISFGQNRIASNGTLTGPTSTPGQQ